MGPGIYSRWWGSRWVVDSSWTVSGIVVGSVGFGTDLGAGQREVAIWEQRRAWLVRLVVLGVEESWRGGCRGSWPCLGLGFTMG